MSKQMNNFPEYHDANKVVVNLLKGVIYVSDEKVWDLLLLHKTKVSGQLGSLGLILVLDEHEGYAFVRQVDADDQVDAGYKELPKIFHRKRLGYGASILAVILRDELRKFDESEMDSLRASVESERLYELWVGMVKEQSDERKSRREFNKCLSKMEDIGFIKRITKDADDYELKRILKARISINYLQELIGQLSVTVDQQEGEE